jgi:hypothetical protein
MAWICTPEFHSALLHHHRHSPCAPCTPYQALFLSSWRTSVLHEFIILPFKLHFDSLQANLPIPTLQISQIKPNIIGIQFRTLARPESFGKTGSTSSFFASLMNCVFLRLSALMRWDIQWMKLRLCLFDIIQSLSQVIVSGLPAFIIE